MARKLEGLRVDLVIFEGEEEHSQRDQQDFFWLWWSSRDFVSMLGAIRRPVGSRIGTNCS